MLCITVLYSFSVFLFRVELFYSLYIVFFVFHTGDTHIQTNIDALGFSWNPKLMSSPRSSSLGTEETGLFSSEALWDMRTKLHCLVLKRWCRTQRTGSMMSPYFSSATGQWGSAAALLCGWPCSRPTSYVFWWRGQFPAERCCSLTASSSWR